MHLCVISRIVVPLIHTAEQLTQKLSSRPLLDASWFVEVETASKDMAADLQREHRLKPEKMSRMLAGQVTSSITSIRNDWGGKKGKSLH